MIRSGKRPRRTPGALGMVILLLVASAGLRLASGTGAAIAREVQDLPPSAATGEVARGPSLEELDTMLAAFEVREKALDEKEANIAARMADLRAAEETIATQMEALVAAEEELRATLALADGASETDLTRLTAVYENMKPKEAAALFEEMDAEFAAGFIARMRADAAAGIMAGLSPQAAYSISAVMAGRHMGVPTQ